MEVRLLRTLDGSAVRRWAARTVHNLTLERAAIDRINVYPVADGDTGTNLLHTARVAWRAIADGPADPLDEALASLAKGAVTGARGNSGVLLAQTLRGFADSLSNDQPVDGGACARALHAAHRSAATAVAEPAAGTLLSVLASAAEAASAITGTNAARESPGEAGVAPSLAQVLGAATRAAIDALAATPEQLPALGRSGVVDAGGRGLVVVLDTLHEVVTGDRLARELPERGASDVAAVVHPGQYDYEVMYLVSDVEQADAELLRHRLAELGECVSVAHDGTGEWAVHVHCNAIGPAIEAGVEIGRVRRIDVTRFADQGLVDRAETRAEHVVLACVASGYVAELFAAEGVHVVRVSTVDPSGNTGQDGADPAADELCAAVHACAAEHVVLLPNTAELAGAAEEAARRAADAGSDVVVVPTVSPVQGLAAVAVHDTNRRRASDQVAMAEAAAATRRAELLVSASDALTWVGPCAPGDVLGLVDGEVVLIAKDVATGTRELLDRVLATGGELVTALLGRAELDAQVRAHLHRTHPEVEYTTHLAADLDAVLVLGVEQ